MTAALHDWQDSARQARRAKSGSIATVLVPLDGSASAKAALPVARTVAELYAATLHIICCRGEELADPREALQALGLTSEEVRGAVLAQAPAVSAEALVALMRETAAPLLVMSTHLLRANHVRGSLVDAVLSMAPERILLVTPERGDQPWQIRRVLLAHDGSPSADVAAAPAADIAHRAGAEVTATHVAARKAPQFVEPGSLPAPRYLDQPHHEWPQWTNEFVERMLALGSPVAAVKFTLLVTGGQPGSELADLARDIQADLIVVSWHGSWAEDRAGTLKAMVRRCICPLLLVAAPEPGGAQ